MKSSSAGSHLTPGQLKLLLPTATTCIWVVPVFTCSVSNVTKLCAKRDLVPHKKQERIKRERNWSAGKYRKESLFYLIWLVKQGWLGKGRTEQYEVLRHGTLGWSVSSSKIHQENKAIILASRMSVHKHPIPGGGKEIRCCVTERVKVGKTFHNLSCAKSFPLPGVPWLHGHGLTAFLQEPRAYREPAGFSPWLCFKASWVGR